MACWLKSAARPVAEPRENIFPTWVVLAAAAKPVAEPREDIFPTWVVLAAARQFSRGSGNLHEDAPHRDEGARTLAGGTRWLKLKAGALAPWRPGPYFASS